MFLTRLNLFFGSQFGYEMNNNLSLSFVLYSLLSFPLSFFTTFFFSRILYPTHFLSTLSFTFLSSSPYPIYHTFFFFTFAFSFLFPWFFFPPTFIFTSFQTSFFPLSFHSLLSYLLFLLSAFLSSPPSLSYLTFFFITPSLFVSLSPYSLISFFLFSCDPHEPYVIS